MQDTPSEPLTVLECLLLPQGQSALETAATLVPTEDKFLQHFQMLRRQFDDLLAKAALGMAILRTRGATKFTHAGHMYFEKTALEQASSEAVATYRARRYADIPRVADWCASIGGDTIALQQVTNVVAIDSDPYRLRCAELNSAVYPRHGGVEFLNEDLFQLSPAKYIFVDPSRRSGSKRTVKGEEYQPKLSEIVTFAAQSQGLGIKVAPAIPWVELEQYREAEIEMISLHGELKETMLWFHDLKSANLRATVLPGPHHLEAEQAEDAPVTSEIHEYLYDPDPAIVRSQLVGNLANQLDGEQFHPAIAYFTSNECRPTPFATVFRVIAHFPYHLKRLRAWLREHNVGRVTIMKRGSKLDANELMPQLKLSGTAHYWLFLTQTEISQHIIVGDLLHRGLESVQ
ncbi:MAG: class I SAM-dependent methyltransferase [Zavarzinella sp.]